jgi:hypothetical protein
MAPCSADRIRNCSNECGVGVFLSPMVTLQARLGRACVVQSRERKAVVRAILPLPGIEEEYNVTGKSLSAMMYVAINPGVDASLGQGI